MSPTWAESNGISLTKWGATIQGISIIPSNRVTPWVIRKAGVQALLKEALTKYKDNAGVLVGVTELKKGKETTKWAVFQNLSQHEYIFT